jgi:hypothetical protein
MFSKIYQFLSFRRYPLVIAGIIVLLVGIGLQWRTSFVPSLDRPIILGYNQVLRIEEEGLEVKFLGIISDSRCPKGMLWMVVTCYWQGQVVALVKVSKNGQDLGNIEFKLIITLKLCLRA